MSPEKNDGHVSPGADPAEHEIVRTQREINQELVLASLRAEEEIEAAEAREKALTETAELRERLLGILGHDLRTPLGAITICAGMLVAHGNLNEDDARVVERLLHSANRMNRMISQILDFTRTRLGGGLLLEQRPTDVGEVGRNVAGELALSTSTSVQCIADGDTTASVDPDRLAEVLSNIAGNAIEHARTGTGVTVHVQGADAHVVVEVRNEGDPIPPDVLPFIFEPFRRAKQRRHSKAGNLGLGLYIASEITRAHGGTLVARSADGVTTFTMRLPRSPPAPPSANV